MSEQLAYPGDEYEEDHLDYLGSPFPLTDQDIAKLSNREKQVLDLYNQGCNVATVSQSLQLDIRYVLGCMDRFIWLNTKIEGMTQNEVKALVMEGYSNEEIASRLFISISTVKKALFLLFRKIDVAVEAKDNLLLDRAVDKLAPQYISLVLDRTQDPDKGKSFLPQNRFLTVREFEITSMIVDGNVTNTQIAERLNVSVGTINGHLNTIYSKIGIHSRHELNVELLELFCPHSIYLSNFAESTSHLNSSVVEETKPLTFIERTSLLPLFEAETIVPLEPQNILTPTELDVFRNLAAFPNLKKNPQVKTSGLTRSQILDLELETDLQLKAIRTNEELSRIIGTDTATIKNYIHNILSKLNVVSRHDAVQLYHFYIEEGILQ